MLVCNSIDTICFTTHLDEETQAYLVDLQFNHQKMPKWLYPTDKGISRYGYGLQSDGISIYYSDSPVLKPNCYIRFSSEVIQRHGYDKVYMRCCNILKSFGIDRPGKTLKLSQIDISFDFQNDFSNYLDDRENFSVSTKLKDSSDRRIHDKVTYRLFGIGSTVGYKVRCYDKLQETHNVEGKLYWHKIWQEMGFSLDHPIWRVEYEIRRDFLKSWKVNSLRSFLRFQRAIQKRLFSLWHIKVLDDTNKTRCSYIPEFDYLIEHFTAEFQKHYVDKRPEEYQRAASLKMSLAFSALLAASVNYGAYHRIHDIDYDVQQSRMECVNLLLYNFNRYGSQPELFEEDVSKALQSRGYYFSPAGFQYAPTSYEGVS